MRSALRQLGRHGVEALRAQKVHGKWRKPVVSKRVAADLRKAAIRSGTYGTFDAETGVGWDPVWDAPERKRPDFLAVNSSAEDARNLGGSNQMGISSIRPPKETKRQRTREGRAQKIEELLEKADEKIEEYRSEQEAKKPLPGIEEEFKRMVKGSGW
ncbi:hypothetical protein ACHAXT_008726 [Thalassiosira profunda]